MDPTKNPQKNLRFYDGFQFFRARNQKCIQDNCCHKDKKLIILTPGGLYGFYTLGVSCYIKNHYNLTDFIFSGSSAGSWNSLFLSYQGNQSIEKPFLEFTKHLQNNTSNLSSFFQLYLLK